jgi:hypothetical protein
MRMGRGRDHRAGGERGAHDGPAEIRAQGEQVAPDDAEIRPQRPGQQPAAIAPARGGPAAGQPRRPAARAAGGAEVRDRGGRDHARARAGAQLEALQRPGARPQPGQPGDEHRGDDACAEAQQPRRPGPVTGRHGPAPRPRDERDVARGVPEPAGDRERTDDQPRQQPGERHHASEEAG